MRAPALSHSDFARAAAVQPTHLIKTLSRIKFSSSTAMAEPDGQATL